MIKTTMLLAIGALTVCQPTAAPETPAPAPPAAPTVDVRVETRQEEPRERSGTGIEVKSDKDGTSVDFKIEKK